MKLKKRLLSLALIVVLVLHGVLLSPALQVDAATADLYGTGSADEINIIKLFDMALNKGGMSMSPSTIQAFLDYWWSSVRSDLSTCINNADSAITTTQAFVDYLYTALENAEHYDKLGSTIKNYVQFVLSLEYKSLSDFKQLLLQPDTFRQFLLSYVTDEDGNIVNTVDNKLKKYNIGKTLVNMTRQAADAYIEEYEGYYLVPTMTYQDILPTYFQNKSSYDTLVAFLKKIDDSDVYYAQLNGSEFVCFSGFNFVNTSYSNVKSGDFSVYIYNDNWLQVKSFVYWPLSNEGLTCFPESVPEGYSNRIFNYRIEFKTYFPSSLPNVSPSYLFTKDGRRIKVWKSLDAFKFYSVGQSNIYYSNAYSNYDSSVDNSVEFSGSYYSSNSSSYSHDVIQNNIDNSSEISESTINNIVNNYITNNNYGDSSGSSGSGGGSGSSGGWWNIGDGISAIFEGVAALLDFALKLLGDLIGLIATFAASLLELLEGLSSIGTEFGAFLKECYSFLPDEVITVIVLSISVMCGLGILKMFKK